MEPRLLRTAGLLGGDHVVSGLVTRIEHWILGSGGRAFDKRRISQALTPDCCSPCHVSLVVLNSSGPVESLLWPLAERQGQAASNER